MDSRTPGRNGAAEENTNPSVNACRERKALRGGSFSESRKSNVKRLKMPGLSRCYDSRNESIRDGRGATGGGEKAIYRKSETFSLAKEE